MVQVNAKIEINLMLEPSIVKIQQGFANQNKNTLEGVHPCNSPRQLVHNNLLQNKQMKIPWGGCMPLYFSQGFDK
jgi:hypothetical protein